MNNELHKPLHRENKKLLNFYDHCLEQKERFQKIYGSFRYDERQQTYEYFSIFQKPHIRF